jgi:hypothetical protein
MPATHPIKITVLLDKDEFSRFAAYCEFQGHKKSTLIARLIREHLDAANFRTQGTLPLDSNPRGMK